MATEWTQYDAKVVGTGSLGSRFKIKADEPDSTAKTVKIYWEAWLTANPAAGYYDATEGTPCDLFLGQNQVYNKRTVFDLRNGLSDQKIAEGSHTVSYSEAPNGSITFSWTFDGRAYWDQIKQPTIISGNFQLPELTVDYTPTTDKAEYTLGESVVITTNAPSAEYTHDITYLNQGKTQTDIQKGVTDRVQWTVPEDEVLQAPTTTFFNLTIKVDAKKDGKVIFSKNITVKVNIPETYKPVVQGVSVMETNEKVKNLLNSKGYLRGLSLIRAFPLGIMLAPGAGVVSFVARIKEKPEISVTSTDGNLNFSAFNFPDKGNQQVTIQVAAIDTRGRQSEWVERTINVMYYQAPSIGAMTPIRTGERVVIKRNWSVSSIALDGPDSEKNTAKLSFFVRPQGGEWAENTGANATALSGKDSEAALDGTLPGNSYFEFKVRLEDKLAVVEAGPFAIPTEKVPISMSSNGKIGINRLVNKNGAQLQVGGDGEVMSLLGVTFPFFTLHNQSRQVARIGFPNKRHMDNRELLLVNDAIGKWLTLSDRAYYDGKKLAYDMIEVPDTQTVNTDTLANGFHRINKATRSAENLCILISVCKNNPTEGFQIGWLPAFHPAGLCFRVKHSNVWKPWQKIGVM